MPAESRENPLMKTGNSDAFFREKCLTKNTKDNRDVKCDIALVPIGGTYTMDAKKAAELINSIRPSVTIPTHYGSIVGREEDAEVFAANVKDPIKVEIKKQY